MKRYLPALIIVVGLTLVAWAQSPIFIKNDLVDNQFIYGQGSFTRTAISIPDGKQLLGIGAGATAIHSDAAVSSGSFIASASTGSVKISDLRIESPDVTVEDPFGNTTEQTAFDAAEFQEIGVSLDATEVGRLANCEIEGFRNYGAVVIGTGSHRKLSVDFNKVSGCWHGIKLVTDSSATGNLVLRFLQRGLDVNGSAAQLTANHAYGGKYACYLGPASSQNGLISVNDRFEDSEFGIWANGNYTNAHFLNTRLYHNFVNGALIDTTFGYSFVNPQVVIPNSSPGGGPWPDKVGIYLKAGASHEIIGGRFTLDGVTQAGHGTATPSTALRISANNCKIDTTIYDLDSLAGSKGLHVPSRVVGGDWAFRLYGFEQSGDAALDIDTNDFSGLTILVIGNSARSPGFKFNDAAQYVDVPSGWGIDGAMTGTPELTFSASGKTITRDTGSWVTDGFNIGETVTITGTTSNNISGEAITNVSATVLTLNNSTLVDEVDTTNTVVSKNGSEIKIKDEASGEIFTLTPGTAY